MRVLGHALLLAALGIALAPGAAEARTRTFCSTFLGGGEERACGRHLEPVCDSGAACDSGYSLYSGDPFPIHINCPYPIPDETVSAGCYDSAQIPDCSACGGPGEVPCPAVTSNFCTVGCAAGLEPNPTTTLCEAPGTPGTACGPSYGCADGLTCDYASIPPVCRAEAQAGESCLSPWVGCASGLSCTSGFCSHTPGRLGETCDALFAPCGDSLFCQGGSFVKRCQARARVGEACGPARPCLEGTACAPCLVEECNAPLQCAFEDDVPLTELSCLLNYSAVVATSADLLDEAHTYGLGVGLVQGEARSFEGGSVYGPDGEYGCYTSTCEGADLDVSIEVYNSLGFYPDYGNVAGESWSGVVEAQIPGSLLNYSELTVYAEEPDLFGSTPEVGHVVALGVGIGASPLPAAVGLYQCTTTVNEYIPGPPTDGGGVPPPPEVEVDPAPTVPVPVGVGALAFDGVDDSLAVTDPAALAALRLERSAEYADWEDAIAQCRSQQFRITTVSACEDVLLRPDQRDCILGVIPAHTERVSCCAVGGSWPSCTLGATTTMDLHLADYPLPQAVGPAPSADGSSITFEAWIQPAVAGQTTSFVSKEGEYQMALRGGQLAFTVAYSGGWSWRDTGFFPPVEAWTHVAVVYDGSAARVYADGQAVYWEEASGTIGDAHTDDDQFRIGGRERFPDTFAGAIDAVRVWNRALSPAELRRGLGAAHPRDPSLVAAWDFDEASGDVLAGWGPGGQDLSLASLGAGRAPLRRAEDRQRLGSALFFDGVDDHAAVTEPAALDNLVLTGAVTLEAWVHPVGPGSSPEGGIVVSKAGEYELGRAPDGRITYRLANASPGWVTRTSSAVAPDNTWSHVALVYDPAAGEARVYVDGVLESTDAASGELGDAEPALPQLRIGGRMADPAGATAQGFHGVIDEVRVWAEARTASQIAAAMDAPVRADAANLAGYWRFDEGPMAVFLDASTQAGHGLLGAGREWEAPRRTATRAFFGYPPSLVAAVPIGRRCGLGFEAGLVVAGLGALRRRRRGAGRA